jgi:hypothetical protein
LIHNLIICVHIQGKEDKGRARERKRVKGKEKEKIQT